MQLLRSYFDYASYQEINYVLELQVHGTNLGINDEFILFLGQPRLQQNHQAGQYTYGQFHAELHLCKMQVRPNAVKTPIFSSLVVLN